MTIYKGNDLEFHFGISPCYVDVDPDLIRNLHLDIFTVPGSTAIRKDISDIEISGEIGTVHLEWEELEALEDGVIRFKLDYFYEGEEILFERATNLYLKTPINYQPTTFITEDELEQAVAEAISGISATTVEEVEEIVDTMTADFITDTEAEQMIEDALSGATGKKAYILSDMTQQELAELNAQLKDYVGHSGDVNPGQDNSGATVNDKYDFYYTFSENRVCYRLQYCGFSSATALFTAVVGANDYSSGTITVLKIGFNAEGVVNVRRITDYTLG